ncbi:cellulase family glycosylhydrolase [Candidatus Bathyarchaeota archaeon]|nr:cellulase family glycosylhydrolase [Candidatus Bathyarchaeota archaeon]
MMKPVRKNNDSKVIRIKPGAVMARFLGCLAAILVTGCMGIAVAITTTFPASHWWYYSPQRPRVDFKYPLTILAGDRSLLAIASMVSLGIAGIYWIVSNRGENTGKRMVSKESIPLVSGLLLIIGGGTCLLIPFLYMAGVSTDSVPESLIPVDLLAGPALISFFFGLGCLFIAFRRKQVLTFILAYTFPFIFHVSKTFPSQQSAAEIESAWIYQLIGIASIFIIAMILVLLSSPKIVEKRAGRIANATEVTVKPPSMARAARGPGYGRKARYASIFLTLGLLSMMVIPMAGIVSGSGVQGTRVTVPATGNRTLGTPFGINCHVFSDPGQTDFLTGNPIDMENMEKLGVGWIRSDFWWNTLFQNDSGVPDHEFVEFLDAFVANTSSIGVNIQALLSYGTPWACPEDPYYPGSYNTYPTNLTAWKDYISFCSTRWLGNASMGHFEIYNEPNNGDYWSANSTQSRLFANLTVEAAIEIKSASPANTVFGPGLSHIGLNDPRYPDDGHRNPDFLADWVMDATEMARNAGYPNGFGDLFDAFCCHPYGTWESQLAKYSILNDFVSNQESRFSKSFMRVNSETGCPTSEPTCLPHVQAMATAKAMVTSQLAGFDVFINYEYRDGGSLPDDYSVLDRHDLYGEHFFGLLDHDRNPKPAYYAFGTVSNLLSNGIMLTPAKYHHSSGMMNLRKEGRVMHGAFTTEEGRTCIITWKDGASQETLDLKLQFAGLATGGMSPVNVSDPENHDDRMWDFVPMSGEKVQIDGSVLAISNLPLTSNVSIIIINNASTLEAYTLFYPPSNTAGTWVAMGFLFLPLATVISNMVIQVVQNQQANRGTTGKGSRKRGKMEGSMKGTKASGTKI